MSRPLARPLEADPRTAPSEFNPDYLSLEESLAKNLSLDSTDNYAQLQNHTMSKKDKKTEDDSGDVVMTQPAEVTKPSTPEKPKVRVAGENNYKHDFNMADEDSRKKMYTRLDIDVLNPQYCDIIRGTGDLVLFRSNAPQDWENRTPGKMPVSKANYPKAGPSATATPANQPENGQPIPEQRLEIPRTEYIKSRAEEDDLPAKVLQSVQATTDKFMSLLTQDMNDRGGGGVPAQPVDPTAIRILALRDVAAQTKKDFARTIKMEQDRLARYLLELDVKVAVMNRSLDFLYQEVDEAILTSPDMTIEDFEGMNLARIDRGLDEENLAVLRRHEEFLARLRLFVHPRRIE